MSGETNLIHQLTAIRGELDEIASASSLPSAVSLFDDDSVMNMAALATALTQAAERIRLITVGVISARSARSAGHGGLAQRRGHRNATSLVQQVTGSTRAEAARQVRVAESLFESPQADLEVHETGESGNPTHPLPTVLWHAPLREALMAGKLSIAQHDVIRHGLGEPPAELPDGLIAADENASATAEGATPSPAAFEAWSLAAQRLTELAEHITVEDLAQQARAIRDTLDPEGMNARFLARFEARSFRMWTDRNGLSHGSFVFDDESAAWIRTTIDTALRPRKGGPRFVDPTQQAAAKQLKDDPRTNEQLSNDLLIDLMRAGTLVSADSVLGARQAGVRLVQVVDRAEYQEHQAELRARSLSTAPAITPAWTTRFEDNALPLPHGSAAQQRCNSGVVPVIVDRQGDPLNVGREQRLFTTKQRIALAVRDGGCRWTGCDRPASYCEAHHIDEWVADGGNTDIDRGILLCRFHHKQLHHNGWRITRNELEDFLLHPPPGSKPSQASPHPAVSMRAPLPLQYAWQHAAASPPPRRFIQHVA